MKKIAVKNESMGERVSTENKGEVIECLCEKSERENVFLKIIASHVDNVKIRWMHEMCKMI